MSKKRPPITDHPYDASCCGICDGPRSAHTAPRDPAVDPFVDLDPTLNWRRMAALEIAGSFGPNPGIDRAWVIDQIVRRLTGCPKDMQSGVDGESDEYKRFVESYGDLDGWNTGREP